MSDDLSGAAGANNGEGEFDEKSLPNFGEIDVNNATPEQVGSVVKAAQTLLGQTKHWRGKAIDKTTGKSFAELLAEAQKNGVKPPTPQSSNPGAENDDMNPRLTKLELSEEKR